MFARAIRQIRVKKRLKKRSLNVKNATLAPRCGCRAGEKANFAKKDFFRAIRPIRVIRVNPFAFVNPL